MPGPSIDPKTLGTHEQVMAGIKYLLHIGLNTVRISTEEELVNCMEMAWEMNLCSDKVNYDRLEAFRVAKKLSTMTDAELLKFIGDVVNR